MAVIWKLIFEHRPFYRALLTTHSICSRASKELCGWPASMDYAINCWNFYNFITFIRFRDRLFWEYFTYASALALELLKCCYFTWFIWVVKYFAEVSFPIPFVQEEEKWIWFGHSELSSDARMFGIKTAEDRRKVISVSLWFSQRISRTESEFDVELFWSLEMLI